MKVNLECFALAYYEANAIVLLTGGYIRNGTRSTNSVYSYDLCLQCWKEICSMKQARHWHSSCSLGRKVYVFAGESKPGGFCRSIESLDMHDNTAWKTIKTQQIGKRCRPIVCPISNYEILILGGWSLGMIY